MKHPTPEEWMSFLYDELKDSEHAGLADHLTRCPECAAQVRDWEVARKNLHWPIRTRNTIAKRAPAVFAGSLLKWAAAAMIMAAVSFGAGRLTAPAADMSKVRAALTPEIQQQLQSARTEMRQEFAQMLRRELEQNSTATLAAAGEQSQKWLANCVATLEAERAEENQNWYADLERMQSQHAADCLQLKKDVDTLAVNADAGLRHTEQQLIQIAGLNQTDNPSQKP